ncbi:MAG: hypothetical protein BGN88_08770 [Clostridiales bacterium 43-6]|nr:MAG: hypothetical protein BGN88_08770 [Clostridiales bacterium 43-6]
MQVSDVNSNSYINSTTTKKTGEASLDMDDFFTLLAAQLKNQNMFEPTSDTEFIAQMAQFSSLQQMKDLGKTYQNTYAVSLIGKNVTVSTTDDNGLPKQMTGMVEKVDLKADSARICIDGKYYETANVIEIKNS